MEFGMVPRLRLASTCGSYKRKRKTFNKGGDEDIAMT